MGRDSSRVPTLPHARPNGAPSRGARAASRRRGVMASRASTGASTGASSNEDWRAFASGTSAGALSALALQPLDVLKTRLQVQDEVDARRARYAGAWRGARRIVAEEGARGLFAGTTPAVVGSAVSWGTYFAWYDAARTRYARASASASASSSAASREGGDGSVVKGLPASVNALAATEAGLVTTVVTNPIWVVKTRLQLQRGGGAGGAGERYAGFVDALVKIARKEGVGGLYKGLVPSVWLVSHGSIQLTAYEWLKEMWASGRERNPRDWKPIVNPTEAGALGLASKFIAVSTTYPIQVVRARMQQRADVYRGEDAPVYARAGQAFAQTIRREGVLALYKGFAPNVFRVLPSSAITFAAYEGVYGFLIDRFPLDDQL